MAPSMASGSLGRVATAAGSPRQHRGGSNGEACQKITPEARDAQVAAGVGDVPHRAAGRGLLQAAPGQPQSLAPQVLHRTAVEAGPEGVLKAAARVVGALLQVREADRFVAVGVHPVEQRIQLAGAVARIGVTGLVQQGWGEQFDNQTQQQVIEAQGLRRFAMASHHPVQKRQKAVEPLERCCVGPFADLAHQRRARHPQPPFRPVRRPVHRAAHRLNVPRIHPDRQSPQHVVVGAPGAGRHQQQGVAGEIGEAAPSDSEVTPTPVGHHQGGSFAALHLPLQPRSPERHEVQGP